MRKLLLATVAGMAASLGVANAQTAPAQAPAPPASLAPMPAGSTTDKSLENPTQPGTVVVRLNGRVNFYAAAYANGSVGSNTTVTSPTVSTTVKQSSYNFGTYARLFPGFDGVAANGMQYGAHLEVRNDSSSTSSGLGGLYWQRAYGYLGTPEAGRVRLGYADGPVSLFLTGTQESFNDGGWDGDVPGFLAGQNIPNWPALGDYGGIYATSKVVYVSPSFAGLDFGVGFEPNSASRGVSGVLASNNNTAASNGGLRRNTGDVTARYTGTFGATGLVANADWLYGGAVNDASTPSVGNLYDGLNVVSGGVSVTIGGLEFGGWGQGGQYNMEGNSFMKQKGQKNGSAYIAGAQYTIGPVVAGVQWFDSWGAGFQTATNKLTGVGSQDEYGVAAGGTYTLTPGVSIYLSYLWGVRKQNGWDFATSSAGSGSNKTFAQLIGIGTQFDW